jgi:hypothetical protein
VVSDVVEYELPMGLLGDLLNWLAMKRQIRALFAYRQRMLPVLVVAELSDRATGAHISSLGMSPCRFQTMGTQHLDKTAATRPKGRFLVPTSGRRAVCGSLCCR